MWDLYFFCATHDGRNVCHVMPGQARHDGFFGQWYMHIRLRQIYSGQRKINRPLNTFWPDIFLIIPDICQRVTYNKLNIKRL